MGLFPLWDPAVKRLSCLINHSQGGQLREAKGALLQAKSYVALMCVCEDKQQPTSPPSFLLLYLFDARRITSYATGTEDLPPKYTTETRARESLYSSCSTSRYDVDLVKCGILPSKLQGCDVMFDPLLDKLWNIFITKYPTPLCLVIVNSLFWFCLGGNYLYREDFVCQQDDRKSTRPVF